MSVEFNSKVIPLVRETAAPVLLFAAGWAVYILAFRYVRFSPSVAAEHWLSPIHRSVPLFVWIAIKHGLLIVSIFAIWRGAKFKALVSELVIAIGVFASEFLIEYPMRSDLPAAVSPYFSL